jgi:predicted CoA-binding protein
MQENIESPTGKFLAARSFAVAGASRDRTKYGNKVFQALVASGREVVPLNPSEPEIEGHTAYPSIAALPGVPESLSIVTPPHVTRLIVQQAITAGVKSIWMQPGAEDPPSSQLARQAGLNVVDDGSCVLVLLAMERSRPTR